VLCDTTVAGIVDAYDFINTLIGHKLVKKVQDISCFVLVLCSNFSVIQLFQAWEHCIAKEWNFSDECLTSKKSCTALNKYLCSHTKLYEDKAWTGTIHGIKDMESQTPSLKDSYDDTDVPSSVVIRDMLGVEVSGGDVFEQTCVRQVQKDDERGGLIADDDKENIWAWNNGKKWGDELSNNDGDTDTNFVRLRFIFSQV
jgi:hypothetical protein